MDRIIFDTTPSMRSVDVNGYMHVALTPISKACVNPYLGREIPNAEEAGLKPDEVYYGLRDPDELKKAAATFNGLPLLLNHHEESAEKPQKEYRVGSTGTDAVFDGTYLKNSLSITDKAAIDLVESGEMREISCAYYFHPEFKSGEYNGVHYDFIMRDIAGNHVALVAEGRAGHDVAVADEQIKEEKQLKIAKDAENAEIANFAKCVLAVEAQKAGMNPADVGLPEIAGDTPIEEIIKTYLGDLDDETKAKKVEMLEMIKGDKVADEEPKAEDDDEPKGDEEPAKDDELTEKLKDPVFREAFEMGVKYGEKQEKADPEKIDADHEHDGEERYLEKVGDSAEKIKADAKAETLAHVKALNAAARDCRAVVGDVDPLAFDSAEAIYALALKQMGYKYGAGKSFTIKDVYAIASKEQKAAVAVADEAIEDELPEGIRKYL